MKSTIEYNIMMILALFSVLYSPEAACSNPLLSPCQISPNYHLGLIHTRYTTPQNTNIPSNMSWYKLILFNSFIFCVYEAMTKLVLWEEKHLYNSPIKHHYIRLNQLGLWNTLYWAFVFTNIMNAIIIMLVQFESIFRFWSRMPDGDWSLITINKLKAVKRIKRAVHENNKHFFLTLMYSKRKSSNKLYNIIEINRILKLYILKLIYFWTQMRNMPRTQIQLRSLVVNGKISLIKMQVH